MALRLITADERLAEANNKVTAVVFGRSKIGKTSLLHTLDPATTICLDYEAGEKSVQSWRGHSIRPASGNWSWPEILDVACVLGGPDPSKPNPSTFSEEHHAAAVREFGGIVDPARYLTIFVDSITDLTRICLSWARRQPEAFSEKSGKPNPLGAYGLLGQEVIALLKHIQHAPGKNAIFVGGLDLKTDDFNREIWQPQTEGGKTGSELPYIVDQIITMSDFDYSADAGWIHNLGKGAHRAFVCRAPNPWGLPAGDRSGNLDLIEEPHLGRLIEKINLPAKAAAERLQFSLPDTSAADTSAAAAGGQQPEPTSSKKGK
jgi:hypothetical protein